MIPLADRLAHAALLEAAARAGVLDAVLAEPSTAAELAQTCNVDERALLLVLDALLEHDLVRRDEGGRFEAGEELRTLDEASPGGFAWLRRLWGHLPTFLLTGEPHRQMDGDNASRAREYEDIVTRLGGLFEPAAESIAQRLGPAPTVLDLGAGSGVWSLAMARRSEASRVCAVDFPPVLKSFAARAKALGLTDRAEAVAGDLHTLRLDRRFHRVVLANVLHLEPPDRAQAVIRRCVEWLLPDGELVIIGSIVADRPEAAQARSMYSLHLAMRTVKGENHTAEQLDRWCRQAGFSSTRVVPSDAPSLALGALVARRQRD